MTAQTNAQRKAAERARNKAAGLTRLELWVKPEHHAKLKHIAATLLAGRIGT